MAVLRKATWFRIECDHCGTYTVALAARDGRPVACLWCERGIQIMGEATGYTVSELPQITSPTNANAAKFARWKPRKKGPGRPKRSKAAAPVVRREPEELTESADGGEFPLARGDGENNGE